MANKKQMDEAIKCNLYMDKAQIEKLDYLAAKAGISRSRLLRNLIEVGIEEMSAMDRVGLITFVSKIEDGKKALRQLLTGSGNLAEA